MAEYTDYNRTNQYARTGLILHHAVDDVAQGRTDKFNLCQSLHP